MGETNSVKGLETRAAYEGQVDEFQLDDERSPGISREWVGEGGFRRREREK